MNHILCNIIDRIEVDMGSTEHWYVQGILEQSFSESMENAGEWFEYVWSTTRAIRKDITQQELNKARWAQIT